MKILRLFIFIFIAITVYGCASSGNGSQFVFERAKSTEAIIYHYRPYSFRGNALQWDVLSNGQPLTRIGNGGYFKQLAVPGNIKFHTKDNRQSIFFVMAWISNLIAKYEEAYTIDVEAGQTYFLRWRVQLTKNTPLIREIPYGQALKELDGLLSFAIAKQQTEDHND